MENEKKLIEIMTEMLQEQRQTNVHLLSVDQRLERAEDRLDTLNTHMGNVENEIIQIKENGYKINLAIDELYRSIRQLNDQMTHFGELDSRVRKIEQFLKIT